jgi:hypothetical protein
VVTLEGLPFNSSMISFNISLFKKINTIHCKTMFTCWVFLFCNVHTWANFSFLNFWKISFMHWWKMRNQIFNFKKKIQKKRN